MSETTTIRIRRETRDRINRLAQQRGVSTPDLVGGLVDRAEDDVLFERHASAYEEMRRTDPDLLREIESEDRSWDRADLSAPPEDS